MAFTEGLGDFGFEKCASRKKEKSDCSGKKKKEKKKETNPPDASQLCFLVLPQGQRWKLAGSLLVTVCSAPKAMGQGQEALKSSQFGGWVGEGNRRKKI